MLDSRLYPKFSHLYETLLRPLAASRLRPTHLSFVGFALGLLTAWLVYLQYYWLAILPLLLNRIFDGLDGALARVQDTSSPAGAFLDICLDFCFYALFVLAFGLSGGLDGNFMGLCAAFLLFSYILTASSFLALSAALARTGQSDGPTVYRHKGLHFVAGLCEGTETIMAMLLMLIFPAAFCGIALVFGALCVLTALVRVYLGVRHLSRLD